MSAKFVCKNKKFKHFLKIFFSFQRENEILIFLIVVVIFKCRKSSSYLHTFSTIYLYSKLANALLFFRVKPIYGLFYCVVVITLYILVDEPLPPDSEKIRFFNGEELKVCFFNIFYPQKTWMSARNFCGHSFRAVSKSAKFLSERIFLNFL